MQMKIFRQNTLLLETASYYKRGRIDVLGFSPTLVVTKAIFLMDKPDPRRPNDSSFTTDSIPSNLSMSILKKLQG